MGFCTQISYLGTTFGTVENSLKYYHHNSSLEQSPIHIRTIKNIVSNFLQQISGQFFFDHQFALRKHGD